MWVLFPIQTLINYAWATCGAAARRLTCFGVVLEVRNLVTRANLVPWVFSLSNIGEREDPEDEVKGRGWSYWEERWGREIENTAEMADDFTN